MYTYGDLSTYGVLATYGALTQAAQPGEVTVTATFVRALFRLAHSPRRR